MLLSRVRVLAAEIETSAGTAETPAAADATFNVFDAVIQPLIENEQRPSQGSFSHLPAVPGQRWGTATFRTELYGDGAGGVPAWATTFLPACRWVNTTGTFSPVSQGPGSSAKTLTIGAYINGLYKQLHGAMGTVKFTFPTRKICFAEWQFWGIYSEPSDVAILTPTYSTIKPFSFYAETLTLASWTPVVSSMTLDLGNNIIARPDATKSSGILTALATDGLVTGTMDPEAKVVATVNHVNKWLAMTEEALTIELDNGTDRITFAAPKAQRTNVQEGNRDGLVTDEIEFQCNKSGANGNDELTIAFAATD